MSQIWYATESSLSAPRLAGPRDRCPLNGRRLNQEDTFSLGTHLCMKMQTVIVLEALLVVLHTNVGDAMSCSRRMCCRVSRPGTRVFTFRLQACDASHFNTRGLLGSTASSQNLQGTEAYLLHTTGQKKKRHHMFPGNSWESRVPTTSSSTTYSVSNVWYFRIR